RPPISTVIKRADLRSPGIDAVDQPAVEIGRKELSMIGIEGDITDAGPAVAFDVGEFRDRTGSAVNLPDRSGSAAILGPELALHESRARHAAALPLRLAITVRIRGDDADTMQ